MKQQGFTLIELAITMLIVAILVSLAAPSFSGKMAELKLESQVYEFVRTLEERRINAVTKQQNSDVYTVANNSTVKVTAKSGAPTAIVFNERGIAGELNGSDFTALTSREVEYEFEYNTTGYGGGITDKYSVLLSRPGRLKVVKQQ